MKIDYYKIDKDGFYGAYFQNPKPTDRCIIAMIGNALDDKMAFACTRWLLANKCNIMTMAPAPNDFGHHNYPIERFEKAIQVIKEKGNSKIGILGASTTGMLALIAASYYSDITLTIALTPSDFVVEGFYQDGLDNCGERPGDGESSVSYEGNPLPYLPYAYRHPQYWKKMVEEAKATKNRIASRALFDQSEAQHPLTEEEMIKIERIQGKLVLVGAEDDAIWDTCRYIRRMEDRLQRLPHSCEYETWTYEHGTHFVFPDRILKFLSIFGSSLVVKSAFHAGKKYGRACKKTRVDIDNRMEKLLKEW